MSDLYIFDHYDNLLTILSNETNENNENVACPFWNAPFKEELNRGSTFTFNVPAGHSDAQYVEEENQAAFKDKDGFFRLFFIRETDSIDGDQGPEITAICEPAFMELEDEPIEDVRPINTTALDALNRALVNTRWKSGTVGSFGNKTTNFYYISAKEALQDIINTWGGEFRDRIEITNNKISGRFIDLLTRRGADTGKRWEIDKDIISINRNRKSYVKTALYGRGKSLETENGGFTRKITFADVEWKVANGDPVDKPLGQEWVGDPGALNTYGYKNTNGTLRHRYGFYENGNIDDPATLLQDTWEQLQLEKLQFTNFSIDGFLLENVEGLEFEKVRLGDTNFAIDRNFADPIEVEVRAISYEYDISSSDDIGKVEFGQFIDLYNEDRELQQVISKLNEREGIWDQVENPINGGDFPDTIPNVPTLTASGLFQTIMLEWTFQSDMFVADYELYASQVSGFTPDGSNLIYRGKSSGFTHSVDTNQQWYYKVRGVNTHGNASAFSTQASANTARIITDEIMFGAITSDLLANLAVTAAKLADGSVTEVKVGAGAISNTKLKDLAVTAGKLADGSVTEIKVGAGAITNTKLGDLAVDAAKLANSAVIESKVATGAVTNTKLGDLAVTAAKLADGAVTELKIGNGAITNPKLASLAVESANLANSSVTSTKIANLAVGNAAIQNLAVTSAKIADLGVTTAKIDNAAIVEAKIANLAVGTAAIQDLAVTTAKIANLAVGNAAIQNLAVTSAKIADLGVTTAKIDNAAIVEAKIASLAVGNAAIQDLAVTSAKIADLGVTNAKIDNAAITSAKIANLAVGTAAIQNLAVTNAKMALLSVGTAQMIDAAITNAKIANLAVDDAKIANLAVTTGKIADAAITNAKIANLDAAKITTGILKAIDIQGVTIEGSRITSTDSTFGDVTIDNGQVGTLKVRPYTLQTGWSVKEQAKLGSGELTARSDYYSNTTGTGTPQWTDLATLRGSGLTTYPGQSRPFTFSTNTGWQFQNYVALFGSVTGQVGEIQCLKLTQDISGNSTIENPFGVLYLKSKLYTQFFVNGVSAAKLELDGSHTNLKLGRPILKGLSGLDQMQVRNGADTAYAVIAASDFVTVSKREYKKNFETFADNALSLVNSTKIYRYHLLEDLDSEFKRTGVILDESPPEIADISGEGINSYQMTSVLWKAVQELSAEVELLKNGGMQSV